MRTWLCRLAGAALGVLPSVALAQAPVTAPESGPADAAAMVRRIYAEALAHGKAHDHLRELVGWHPGRLSGSKALADAIDWAERTLRALGAAALAALAWLADEQGL